jgi:large subunit ribosomal protein L30
MLRIKLVKSACGNNPRNRATIQALGLKKIRQVVEHKDTPSIRGMIHHVKHVLHVEEVADPIETVVATEKAPEPKKTKAAKVEAEASAAEAPAAEEEAAPKPAKKPRAKKEEGDAE